MSNFLIKYAGYLLYATGIVFGVDCVGRQQFSWWVLVSALFVIIASNLLAYSTMVKPAQIEIDLRRDV